MATTRRQLTSRMSAEGPPLSYRAYLPERGAAGPPLVLVHGVARACASLFRAFLPMAIARDVPLLGPTFPRDKFPGYQQLSGADGPLAAQRAMLGMLEDARSLLGASVDVVDLLGFSGGAQFAHRFAMFSPERVRRVVAVSAGWYTYLQPDRPFPQGAGASEHSGGLPVDVGGFLQLPAHVLVGGRDTERGPGLRTGKGIDRRQGEDRLIRALRWMDHLEERAVAYGLSPRATFDLLPDTGHSLRQAVAAGGLVARALEFLHPTSAPALAAVPAVPMSDAPAVEPLS